MKRLIGSDTVVETQISDMALVTAFTPSSSQGIAVIVNERSVLTQLDHFLIRELGVQTLAATEIKVIGRAALVLKVEAQLKSGGIVVAKTVEKDEPFKALFYPTTGRLRVEKPQESSPPIQTKSDAKIRILVIDDSPTIHKLLKTVFSSDPRCEVVGTVLLPSQADDAIQRLKPDVITMDIHMPEMTGLELLKILHPKHGIPTVMITSVSRAESETVLDALSSGAVDYIQKPSLNELDSMMPVIVEKVVMAAKAKTKRSRSVRPRERLATAAMDPNKIVAIGSSTGGTEALREIFERLPAKIPPIVVVQHIPAVFSEALARRLNDLCPFEVKEAADGDELQPGRVLIAPGGKQMKLKRGTKGTYKVVVFDGEPVNRHRPSVDVLFDSVSELVGKKAVGVILTGMGTDGAKGLLKMKQQGAHTIAQNEASCVVFGMPREAIRLEAAAEIVALDEISESLVTAFSRHEKSA